MPFYRIYPLGPSGRVSPPVDAECADDSAAIVAASLLEDQVVNGCEVWELTRFLGRFHFGPMKPRAPLS